MPILERAQRLAPRSHLTISSIGKQQHEFWYLLPFWWQSVLCHSSVSKNRNSKSRLSQEISTRPVQNMNEFISPSVQSCTDTEMTPM